MSDTPETNHEIIQRLLANSDAYKVLMDKDWNYDPETDRYSIELKFSTSFKSEPCLDNEEGMKILKSQAIMSLLHNIVNVCGLLPSDMDISKMNRDKS